MGENNKILSVSYGTFSCRLEGFDDSVETLKAVVSYFHDLAGHDRFMDMDPQAPDLEQLAEIAVEGEDAPVEAFIDEAGVNLRVAREDEDEEAEAEDASLSSLRLLTPAPVDDATDADVSDEEDDVVAEDEETGELEELSADDTLEDDVDEVMEAGGEVDDADDVVEESAEADADFDDEVGEGQAEDQEQDDDWDEALSAEAVEDEDDSDDADMQFYDRPDAEDAPPADDSVAAKLERIRAVVGRVPPPNHRPTSREAVDQDRPVSSVVDRLSALTGKDNAAQTDEPEEEEALVDDFDFEAEESTPLVLSDEDSAAQDDASDDETVSEDETSVDEDESEEAAEDEVVAMRRNNYSKAEHLPENDDDAMSRILSKTDAQLNEPEGRRHRDAFAQLKAAVAATEAARQLGDNPEDTDPKDAFRDDFSEATRSDNNEDRPISRPISRPLKLVAEQRIETPPSDPAERLRQIASVKETGDVKGGFAEFAAEQGATELGDLLEAAAAYISFVEGDQDFSRPQVMKKVQMAANDEFSREDGLRSFGRLLRQSRIIKLNNGRFQVSEDTRFRPDSGEAAQV